MAAAHAAIKTEVKELNPGANKFNKEFKQKLHRRFPFGRAAIACCFSTADADSKKPGRVSFKIAGYRPQRQKR
jgi:hypothetical protein